MWTGEKRIFSSSATAIVEDIPSFIKTLSPERFKSKVKANYHFNVKYVNTSSKTSLRALKLIHINQAPVRKLNL